MNLAFPVYREPRLTSVPHTIPIVFVVDDDISMRESLESLIRRAGWRAERFASAQEFLARPRVFAPSCLVLEIYAGYGCWRPVPF